MLWNSLSRSPCGSRAHRGHCSTLGTGLISFESLQAALPGQLLSPEAPGLHTMFRITKSGGKYWDFMSNIYHEAADRPQRALYQNCARNRASGSSVIREKLSSWQAASKIPDEADGCSQLPSRWFHHTSCLARVRGCIPSEV